MGTSTFSLKLVTVDQAHPWLPPAGEARAIKASANGAPVNYLEDVIPPVVSGVVANKSTYIRITRAWNSAAFAESIGTNGAMLVHGGGDGDYWGNEVYAFKFDERRWCRFSNSTPLASTSDPDYVAWMDARLAQDPNANVHITMFARTGVPTTDWRYYNAVETEHGPKVDSAVGFGHLPEGTACAVPHTADSLIWIPGSEMGNTLGAMLKPMTSIAYTTQATGRAHFFDLEPDPNAPHGDPNFEKRRGWGRFSNNRAGGDPLVSPAFPWMAYDRAGRKIYHNYGYLDLEQRLQVNRKWSGGGSYGVVGAFDQSRRLWVMPLNDSTVISSQSAREKASGLRIMEVDSSTTFSPAVLSGDAPWNFGQAYNGGFQYVPELDAYFFYTQGSYHSGVGFGDSQNIWRIDPPSSNPLTNAWNVKKITMGGEIVKPDDGSDDGGITGMGIGNYRRFFWHSVIGCFVIYNGPTKQGLVYLYRPDGT
jgi:hypothetical protein